MAVQWWWSAAAWMAARWGRNGGRWCADPMSVRGSATPDGMAWLLWSEVSELLRHVGVFSGRRHGTLLCAPHSYSPSSVVPLCGGGSLWAKALHLLQLVPMTTSTLCVVSFLKASSWSYPSLPRLSVLQGCFVVWLGVCRSSGSRRWMFAEAAASGGDAVAVLCGKPVALHCMGGDPVL